MARTREVEPKADPMRLGDVDRAETDARARLRSGPRRASRAVDLHPTRAAGQGSRRPKEHDGRRRRPHTPALGGPRICTATRPRERARPSQRDRRRNGAGGCCLPQRRTDEQALDELLAALHAVRDGDFSVRLPARRGSLMGEMAPSTTRSPRPTSACQRARSASRRVIGREGRMTERVGAGRRRRLGPGDAGRSTPSSTTWSGRPPRSPASSTPWPRATSPRRWRWRSRASRSRASSCASAPTVNAMVDQLSVVRRRGHPRRPRGGHRGQARRPGRRSRASPARGRTSPTTVNSMAAT